MDANKKSDIEKIIYYDRCYSGELYWGDLSSKIKKVVKFSGKKSPYSTRYSSLPSYIYSWECGPYKIEYDECTDMELEWEKLEIYRNQELLLYEYFGSYSSEIPPLRGIWVDDENNKKIHVPKDFVELINRKHDSSKAQAYQNHLQKFVF